MLASETVVKIRVDHLRDKVPFKAIAQKRGIARNTARKAVREGSKAFGDAAGCQPKPKLGHWTGEPERTLAGNAKLPRCELPTLTRIHEDFEALGCGVGYDSVRRHAAAGGTPKEIVKTTIFLTDMDEFARVNGVYAKFFGRHRPARSTVKVSSPPLGAKAEIETIIEIGASKK